MSDKPKSWKAGVGVSAKNGRMLYVWDLDIGEPVAMISFSHGGFSYSKTEEEAFAVGELLAGAPEMLAALEELVEVLTEPVYDEAYIKMPGEDRAVKRAQDIIKKVTGQK